MENFLAFFTPFAVKCQRGCFTAALLLFTLFLAACQTADNSWSRIQNSGLLRVGLDPTFPPFEVDEGAGVQGIDVDLARAIAAGLQLQAEFVYFGYDGLYDALATQQVDVLISALVISPERLKDFAYSSPYFNAGQILIADNTTADFHTFSEMAQKTVAVELGSQGHVEALNWQRRLNGLEIRPFATPDEAITAVSNQQADAALVDAVNGRLALQNHPTLTWLPEPVTVEPYALVVRQQDQQLLEQLNNTLATLYTNGTLDQIITRWLEKDGHQ